MLKIQFGIRRLASLTACLTTCVAMSAQAAEVDVMMIGDSLTYGFSRVDSNGNSVSPQSNGGWRVPLDNGLNSNPLLTSNTYNFIGNRGDNNANTGGNGEANLEPDGFDGFGETAVAFHEGYGGWVIDNANRTAGHISRLPGRSDIKGNLTSAGGAIAPQNADVVMLMIGTNDITGMFFTDSSVHTTVDPIVASLGALIDDIVALAPDATLLVSTLLPAREGQSYGNMGGTTDQFNAQVDLFNEKLRADFFGEWLDDSLGTDVYAEHSTYSNVLLLDANSAIDPGASAGDVSSDDLHLTEPGYAKVGQFYEDRFVALNIVPSPSSAAVFAVLGGLAMCRRRRAA